MTHQRLLQRNSSGNSQRHLWKKNLQSDYKKFGFFEYIAYYFQLNSSVHCLEPWERVLSGKFKLNYKKN